MTVIPVPQRQGYSLIRFSIPDQALGDSLRRQLEATVRYCEQHNITLLETIRDEGMSGYHGVHRKRGAFGRFVKRFLAGEIPTGRVLICEGFDRFTREPPRIAQQLFLTLINGGMDVVTLIDDQYYSAATIDANIGQLFMSIGLMLGAHMESKNKGKRIGETWNTPGRGRRYGGIGKETGMVSNIFPGWIVKTKEGPKLDPAKHQTLHRILELLPQLGLEQMAKLFNDEDVPLLNERKRSRIEALWDKTTIQKIIRGRQVLGEQAVGRYVEVKDKTTGETHLKRILTGEVVVEAYPAAWTEQEWQVANATLDQRRHGTVSGRNRTLITNMFGPLAVCGACGGRMKVRGKGRLSDVRYLGCSNAGLHGCTNTQYFRVDDVEADVLPLLIADEVDDTPQFNECACIEVQITKEKNQANKIAAAYERALLRSGELAERTVAKLEGDHQAKRDQIAELERKLVLLSTTKPPSASQEIVRTLLGKVLAGDIGARTKVTLELPHLIDHLIFTVDGEWRMSRRIPGTNATIGRGGDSLIPRRRAIS